MALDLDRMGAATAEAIKADIAEPIDKVRRARARAEHGIVWNLTACLEIEALARKAAKYRAALGSLINAANGLRNNSDGYRAFEFDIRDVIGHTNWSVTRHWIEQADAALVAAHQVLESEA